MLDDPAQLQSRAGRLEEMYRSARIGHHLGMVLHFDGELHAVVDLPYGPHLDHALDGIHGGVLATLIDTASWFTAAVHYENWIATVEFHTRLLEPVRAEDLTAVGSIIRVGRRIATARAEIHSGSGTLVATGTGSFTATGVPIQ